MQQCRHQQPACWKCRFLRNFLFAPLGRHRSSRSRRPFGLPAIAVAVDGGVIDLPRRSGEFCMCARRRAEDDLSEYFRISRRPLVADLVEEGSLRRVTVEGWSAGTEKTERLSPSGL